MKATFFSNIMENCILFRENCDLTKVLSCYISERFDKILIVKLALVKFSGLYENIFKLWQPFLNKTSPTYLTRPNFVKEPDLAKPNLLF